MKVIQILPIKPTRLIGFPQPTKCPLPATQNLYPPGSPVFYEKVLEFWIYPSNEASSRGYSGIENGNRFSHETLNWEFNCLTHLDLCGGAFNFCRRQQRILGHAPNSKIGSVFCSGAWKK
jgi:hypothetical protein